MRKRRKTRTKPPKGYDSTFESVLHQQQLKGCKVHPDKYLYTIQRTYTPDFIHPDYPNELIEVKGRFRDHNEYSKYLHFANCHPLKEIIFIFSKHRTPMPGAKKRKDGTVMSHGEWATKNGFRWYTPDNIPERYSK